jgi:hypothetical protein
LIDESWSVPIPSRPPHKLTADNQTLAAVEEDWSALWMKIDRNAFCREIAWVQLSPAGVNRAYLFCSRHHIFSPATTLLDKRHHSFCIQSGHHCRAKGKKGTETKVPTVRTHSHRGISNPTNLRSHEYLNSNHEDALKSRFPRKNDDSNRVEGWRGLAFCKHKTESASKQRHQLSQFISLYCNSYTFNPCLHHTLRKHKKP